MKSSMLGGGGGACSDQSPYKMSSWCSYVFRLLSVSRGGKKCVLFLSVCLSLGFHAPGRSVLVEPHSFTLRLHKSHQLSRVTPQPSPLTPERHFRERSLRPCQPGLFFLSIHVSVLSLKTGDLATTRHREPCGLNTMGRFDWLIVV